MPKIALFALSLGAALLIPTLAHAGAKPAQSENQTSGVGEVWLGYSFLSFENVPGALDDSYPDLGGAFRVNIPGGGDLNFQLDLQGESAFVDDTSKNYTGSVLGGGHLSWRDPTCWLLGGFIGVGNGFNANDETTTAWLIGAEGQFYLPDWTFYAQLGYMDADEVDTGTPDAFRDAWFGRGVARFFLDANVKLEGELSFANGEQDTDSEDMDVWGWGLRYERALPGMDAGFFLAYQGSYYAADETVPSLTRSATEHVLKLGLSFAWGIEGQKYVDRHGATLDLPMVTRWSAYGVDVVD